MHPPHSLPKPTPLPPCVLSCSVSLPCSSSLPSLPSLSHPLSLCVAAAGDIAATCFCPQACLRTAGKILGSIALVRSHLMANIGPTARVRNRSTVKCTWVAELSLGSQLVCLTCLLDICAHAGVLASTASTAPSAVEAHRPVRRTRLPSPLMRPLMRPWPLHLPVRLCARACRQTGLNTFSIGLLDMCAHAGVQAATASSAVEAPCLARLARLPSALPRPPPLCLLVRPCARVLRGNPSKSIAQSSHLIERRCKVCTLVPWASASLAQGRGPIACTGHCSNTDLGLS